MKKTGNVEAIYSIDSDSGWLVSKAREEPDLITPRDTRVLVALAKNS